MESNYSKLQTNANTFNANRSAHMSQIEKDSFEPIEYEDIKSEEAIFEVFKANDYTEVVTGIINAIDNYYGDADTYDDYPYFRVQNTCKFVPKLNTPSEILSERQLRDLHAHLPYYNQYKNLKLVFSASRDGYFLNTFYYKGQNIKNSILVIKDDNGCVFGAYASEDYRNSPHEFYGTGETFLFTFFKTERIHCFPSTGLNEYYINSDDSNLSFGCSDNYFSLSLENDFTKGYSKSTQTYKNPPLSLKENFFISKLELWTFWEPNTEVNNNSESI